MTMGEAAEDDIARAMIDEAIDGSSKDRSHMAVMLDRLEADNRRLRAEVGRLSRDRDKAVALLKERDLYIVGKGLWTDFVANLRRIDEHASDRDAFFAHKDAHPERAPLTPIQGRMQSGGVIPQEQEAPINEAVVPEKKD